MQNISTKGVTKTFFYIVILVAFYGPPADHITLQSISMWKLKTKVKETLRKNS